MQRALSIISILVLTFILVACGGGEEDVLPTRMELPTLAPEATDDPTEEIVPTVEEEPTEIPPTEEPEPTEELAEGPPPVPPGAEDEQPPFPPSDGEENAAEQVWTVSTENNAQAEVHDCPDSACETLATLNNGTVLEMVEPGDEWHQILLGDDTGYIASAFVAQTIAPSLAGDDSDLPPFAQQGGEGGGFPGGGAPPVDDGTGEEPEQPENPEGEPLPPFDEDVFPPGANVITPTPGGPVFPPLGTPQGPPGAP